MFEPRYWHGLNRWLNPVGFGCWQIAGEYTLNGKPQGWGQISRAAAVTLIRRAYDEGIRFFDTAAGYGHGSSEAILGEAFDCASQKHHTVVCTKIALTPEEEANLALSGDFASQVEAGLARLRRDRIDVLLLHGPADDLDWKAFDRSGLDLLQAQGKIATYGVSSRSIRGAKHAVDAGFGSCLEWVFHLFERRAAHVLFAELNRRKLNFIARSPLSRGLLSPRYLSGCPVHFDASEFRSSLPQEWIDWTVDGLAGLQALGIAPEAISSFALRFCLSYPEVSVVIPGVHRERHIDALMEVIASGPVEADLIRKLDKALPVHYPPWV